MARLENMVAPLRRWRDAVDAVVDCTRATTSLLLPASCAFCEQPLDSDLIVPQLCADCGDRFTPTKPACVRCGNVLRRPQPERSSSCAACEGRQFAFQEVFSLGIYEGFLAEAVLRMKYEAGQSLAYALGRHLAQMLHKADRNDCYDLVVCTTKHWTKRLITGVNSPEVIMQGLAEQANLPAAADLLVCRRRISKQSMLSPARRQQNVNRAWAVSNEYDVRAARVLLVDDILTTGATAHAIAKVLRQNGAEHVSVAVVGRAIK